MKGRQAVNVTGPRGKLVQDNPHADGGDYIRNHWLPMEKISCLPYSTADAVQAKATRETWRMIGDLLRLSAGLVRHVHARDVECGVAEASYAQRSLPQHRERRLGMTSTVRLPQQSQVASEMRLQSVHWTTLRPLQKRSWIVILRKK